MKRLPNTKALKREIETSDVVRSSIFLTSKATELMKYEDIEDLVLQVDLDNPPPELKGFDQNFRRVRTALARTLWSRGIFVGLSILDELLFSAIRSNTSADPIGQVFNAIKD